MGVQDAAFWPSQPGSTPHIIYFMLYLQGRGAHSQWVFRMQRSGPPNLVLHHISYTSCCIHSVDELTPNGCSGCSVPALPTRFYTTYHILHAVSTG